MSHLANLVLSKKDRLIYNATDSSNRAWSVWQIVQGMAHCQASSVCGRAIAIDSYEAVIPVEHLRFYRSSIVEFISDGLGNLYRMTEDGQLQLSL